jgi:beta-glucanase (GH16 family)
VIKLLARGVVLGAGTAAALVALSCSQLDTTVSPSRSFSDVMDSFDGSTWQKADWSNGGVFGCTWKPDHISYSSGGMNISLDDQSNNRMNHTSGECRTIGSYSYGYFEASMKSARGSGTVSSFFTYDDASRDEIDVEILGKNPSQVQFNYYAKGQGGHEKLIDLGFDSSAGFHTYKIEYGEGYINWYVDGLWQWGVNDQGLNGGSSMPSHPMKIMMNLWNGIGLTDWLGVFNYSSPLKANYNHVSYTMK